MTSTRYLNRECLEDSCGTKYFFGRNGYIIIQDDATVAHITEKRAFLADSRFTDMVALARNDSQRLAVSKAGIRGMLEHLSVSPYSENQKKSAIYQQFKAEMCLP